MQKRRLMKLAAMLLADAKNANGIKFDIGTVGKPSDNTLFQENAPIALDCGTTACAMGLAALSGEFKKVGLSYRSNPGDYPQQIECKWKGRITDYDKAAMRLFNITQNQANYLFSSWTYPFHKKTGAKGEREVVRRIKQVVVGKNIDKYV